VPFAVPPAITTRKPLSCERMKVNWEHPLNRRLMSCFLFREFAGPLAHDLCAKIGSDLITPGLWKPDGYSVSNNASVAYTLGITPTITLATGGPFSVHLIGSFLGSSYSYRFAYHLSQGTSMYGMSCGWDDGNKAWFFVRDNSGSDHQGYEVSTSNVFDNIRHSVVVSDDGAGKLTLYIDGKQDATNFTYSAATVTADRMSVGGGYRGAQENKCPGTYELYECWQRCLSWSEAIELCRNPYGTPDNPRLI